MSYINKLPWRRYIKSISPAMVEVLVIGGIMLLMAGCVGQQTSTTTPTTSTTKKQELFEKAPVSSNEYETPDILRASEIIPPELLEGKNYNVHEDVLTYGFTNYYTIMSPFGTFEAEGDDMLRTRIHEIKAIAALQNIKKSKAFGEAAKKAATSSVKGAWGLISQPVKTISGVPKGVGRLFSRVGEMVKGDRGDSEDSVAKELIGFSAVKRQYAHKMGVDVYSSNEVLQRELNSVSWAGFAGGAGVSLATLAVKSASTVAYISIRGTKFIHGMNQILLDNAPEDLRRLNREKLLQMGVEESVIEEFLRNPNFSPRHETILVHALAEMEGVRNRDQFIKQAYFAESELDASTFQRIAEMIHGYHTQVGPISEIIPVRRVAVGYTSDQTIVIALPADYIYWTERADLGLDAIMRLQAVERPVKRVELWVTGRISQKARKEFEAKGLVVKDQIGDKLMPPSS
jgi:hypothetical protein